MNTRNRFLVAVSLVVFCCGKVSAEQRSAPALRWSILSSTQDARDKEMIDFDTRMDERLIEVLNTSEVFDGRLEAKAVTLGRILDAGSAFASLHYDPTKEMALAPDEASALLEFMSRGGFLLLVENNYAYRTEVFRKRIPGTFFDFLTEELPRRDTSFRVEKLPLTHLVFQGPEKVVVPPGIEREMRQQGYVGETAFYYDGQMVGYTYSLYGADGGSEFVPLSRPFRVYRLMEAGYRVLVNIYTYALTH